ncbi:RNA-directed DNA polymerase, eukaryota, reverse transcriptase zinc-binding domain protein, partial [Tanacetum coccineum]
MVDGDKSREGDSKKRYYHECNSLWRQFDSLVDLHACTCEGSTKLKEHAQLLVLMQFLMGLDDVFNSVRSIILTIEPIPDVKSAFATLSRDESHRNSQSSSKSVKPGPSAFASRPNSSNSIAIGLLIGIITLIIIEMVIEEVPNAKSVSDFRPISLIGCQYKIIGKLLANRLNIVIGDCISPMQSAFIKGRYILDGPLILNEVLDWYRQRKKEFMDFKVDFEKAFDSLRWDFLDLILDKLGFGSKWRAWISGCLHNARSSLLINGSPTKEFELFRGQRQGDPMSPFLFILAMEGLHALTHKAKVLGLFKGASIVEDVSQMANIIGCGASQFPLKYLGVPVGYNIERCTNWNAIIKKFSSKLCSWKARLLSVGGRLLLNKSVLGFYSSGFEGFLILAQIYGFKLSNAFMVWMGVFQLPPTVALNAVYEVGNGIDSYFWDDIWRNPRGGVESNQFCDLQNTIRNINLSDHRDSWQWSLDSTKGFSVASARSLILHLDYG